MCDDSFDDYDDLDDGFEGDDFENDNDFGPPSTDTEPSHDDYDGIDWLDFTLGMGLGQELAYGERRKRRRDMDEF